MATSGLPRPDLAGQRFGRLLVRSLVEHQCRGATRVWLCACDCGSNKSASEKALLAGRSRCCLKCTPEDRFWAYVDRAEEGCWEWLGKRRPSGYVQYRFKGELTMAHRISYRLMVGEIPEGLDLHHKCENPSCVRPDHLQPVTRHEHYTQLTPGSFAYQNLRKTHCPRGHEFTEENTRYVTRVRGRVARQCCECVRQHKNSSSRRKQEKALPEAPAERVAVLREEIVKGFGGWPEAQRMRTARLDALIEAAREAQAEEDRARA